MKSLFDGILKDGGGNYCENEKVISAIDYMPLSRKGEPS